MKPKNIVVMLFLISLLATLSSNVATGEPSESFEKFGPRVSDIIFNVAGSLGAEALDLENGQIDLMDWAVPSDKIDDWLADPEIIMGDYSEAGWYEYDLNLQMWPIGHGAMNGLDEPEGGAAPTKEMDWTFPASWDEGHYWINYSCQRDVDARWFRKALAHLTNRAAIDSQFPGTITPMDTFIFPIIGGWESPSAPTYAYSRTLARDCFDNGGFMDYDEDGVREYCKHVTEREAWKTGGPVPPDVEEIPDIQLWIRNDDPVRLFAGHLLRDELIACNIEVDAPEGSYGQITPHAWRYYDYHIYTGGWGWDPIPDMYYECWHSSKDNYPDSDADNYNRYHRQEYDEIATDFKGASSLESAIEYCYDCQDMLHDDVGCIPLYTMSGYVAHRESYGDFPGEQQYKNLPWEGFINEQGYGYYGGSLGFSSLNAHPQGYEKGGVIRHGLIDPPDILDPVDSESFYEGLILAKIYESLIVGDPTNITNHIPWLCSSASEGTWDNDGRTCSKVTVELLPNVLWHDNELLTPQDINFTYWYKREAKSVGEYTAVKEFHHCDISGNTIDICFNTTSWLALDWVAGVTIIPKHIFEPYPPTLPGDPTVPGSWSFNPEAEDALIGTGPFRCYKDGVVGRIDKVQNEYYHLQANPNYFRKLVQPDFYTAGQPAPYFNDRIDLDDFMTAIGHFGCSYPWPHPTIDPYADVNKDRVVDIDDLMEIAVRFGQTGYNDGYPPHYT